MKFDSTFSPIVMSMLLMTCLACLLPLAGVTWAQGVVAQDANDPPRECLRVTRQPRSRTVPENCTVTFEVAARCVDDSVPRSLNYQWFKNGTPIEGATNASYATDPVHMADSGSSYHAVVSNSCGIVTSSNALLTVSLEGGQLRFVGARPGLAPDTIVLSFVSPCGVPDGHLRPESAVWVSPYDIVGSVVYSAQVDCIGTNVIITTELLRPGATYIVTVFTYPDGGLEDFAGYRLSSDDSYTFTAPIRTPVPFGILRSTTEGNQTLLEWSAGGVLQVADRPPGPWTDFSSQSDDYLVISFPCAGQAPLPQRFYRVRWDAP